MEGSIRRRPATCCCWPLATINRRRKIGSNAGIASAEAAVSNLAVLMGLGGRHRRHPGGSCDCRGCWPSGFLTALALCRDRCRMGCPGRGELLKSYVASWRIARNARVLHYNAPLLLRTLMNFPAAQLVGQPLPASQRTDDRYELLTKLQGVLRTLHFDGILVLVDRVDKPYLVNGSTGTDAGPGLADAGQQVSEALGHGAETPAADRVGAAAWIAQERDFHQRARLDKQNLVRSLAWTGQSLYDVANARLKACAADGKSPVLADLLDPAVDARRLKDALGTLRVPRHLFKFLFRLITAHCNAHSDEEPVWQISERRRSSRCWRSTSGTRMPWIAVWERGEGIRGSGPPCGKVWRTGGRNPA